MQSHRLAFLVIVLFSCTCALAQYQDEPYATPKGGNAQTPKPQYVPPPEPQADRNTAIDEAEAAETFREGPRPWDFSLRVFAEHDDNVPLATDGNPFPGEAASIGAGVYADGEYRFVQSEHWTVGAGGSVTQTIYFDEDDNDFNLTSIVPRAYVAYLFNMGRMPASVTGSYFVKKDWLGGDDFEFSHGPQVDFGVDFFPGLHAGVFVGASFDDFEQEGGNPPVTSRDATAYSAGASVSWIFNKGNQSLSGGYTYIQNDADGSDFVYNSSNISAQFWSILFGPVSGAIEGTYSTEDYPDFVGTPQRAQDNYFVRGVIFVALGEQFTWDFYYGYSLYDGSAPTFDSDRSIFGTGLTWRP